MPYFHLYIVVKENEKKRYFLPWNQSEKTLGEVVEAYEKNDRFMLSGRVYYPSHIDKLTVFESDKRYRDLILPNGKSPVGQNASLIAKSFKAKKVQGVRIVTNKFFKLPPKGKVDKNPMRDSMQEQPEIMAYCSQCGFSQGIFENESDMRRKIAVQKKCPECAAVFGFLRDGRIWNLRWEPLSLEKQETAEVTPNPSANIKQMVANQITAEPELNKNIFIVHGKDHKPVKELMVMLNSLGFKPIVLFDQASAGLTIAEKLEKYGEKIGYAFVLLTPDDIGAGPEELVKAPESLKKRARQNVVLEFGYLMGKLGRNRICCLYKGDIELPSDMQGICYVHFNESVFEVMEMIVKERKEAYE